MPDSLSTEEAITPVAPLAQGARSWLARHPAALKSAIVAALIGAWFFSQTWYGLFVFFQNDDLMNMYRAWTEPLARLLAGNVVPFTRVYRPLGSALYRLVYLAAGLNPLPFRAAAYALLLLNIYLLYRLAKRLSGSTEIAVLAALIGSFHHRLADIYLNNGTIYDILCYTFAMLTLLWYMRSRERGFTALRAAALYALLVCAINSKEMAASIPVLLIAYELIYGGAAWNWRTWIRGDAKWALLSVLVVAVAIHQKTLPGGPFSGVAEYKVHLGVRQFFRTAAPLLSNLFLQPAEAFDSLGVIAVYGAVFGIAALSRNISPNNALRFSAIFLFVTTLPIAFIDYRGFFVMYLPLAGWAIFAATLLVESRDWLWQRVWRRPPLIPGAWEPERVMSFLLAGYILFSLHAHDGYLSFRSVDPSQAAIRSTRDQVSRLAPAIPAGALVLFLNDPFAPEEWTQLYLLRLMYRDQTLTVDRVKMFPVKASETARYGCLFDYREGAFVRIPAPGR